MQKKVTTTASSSSGISSSQANPQQQHYSSVPESLSAIFKPQSQPVRRSLPDGSLPPLPISASSEPIASTSSISMDMGVELVEENSAESESWAQASGFNPTKTTIEDEEMDVEEIIPKIDHPTSPITAIATKTVESTTTPKSPQQPEPVTPKQRRQSMKRTRTPGTAAAVLNEPVVPIPLEPGHEEEGEDYGKYHQVLLQALEVAVRKGSNKWT